MPIPRRYAIVALCFLASFICYIDRVNISVAIVAMQQEYDWSETIKGFVLSSFYIGYMLFQIPSGWFSKKYGGRLLLLFAVVWWSIMTMLTPLAAALSFASLIAVRVALGLGESATFPAIYQLFSYWIPEHERSRAITLMASGIPLGTLTALLLTGWFVTNFGWPSVFYLFGSLGFLWTLLWLLLTTERPRDNKHISQRELQLIESSVENQSEDIKVPWSNLLKHKSVIALVINHFCSNWTFYVLLSWLPSYFLTVHGLSISGAGIFSAAPWLTLFLMSNVAAWIADYLITRGTSVTIVRKVMQSIGLVGSASGLYVLQQTTTVDQALIVLCLSMGLLAFTWAGFLPNHLDIAPQYAGVLVGITNTAGTLPGVVGVLITGWLVDVTQSYNAAFALAAGLNLTGAAVWLLASTGKKIL